MADPFGDETWGEISSTETHEHGSLLVVQELIVDWGDRYTIRSTLLAGIGMVYPHATPTAYCKKVSIQPVLAKNTADASGYATFEKAILQAEYRSPSTVDPEIFTIDGSSVQISEEFIPTLKAVRLPYENFEWASDSAPLEPDDAPIKPLYGVEYIQTHHNIVESTMGESGAYKVLWEIAQLVGFVNAASVTTRLLNITFSAQQLLCKPPVIRRTAGNLVTVEYRFGAEFPSWNEFWRGDLLDTSTDPDTYGKWDTIKVKGESETYETFHLADFGPVTD